MKKTAIAPSNIAFIKYWGRKNEALRLPSNGSISMNLSNLLTTTTVEFSKDFTKDTVIINGVKDNAKRVIDHLDRVRKIANSKQNAKVVSKNNFPTATGLSSSASGFAALSVAATKAAGLDLSEQELSILARVGSGSACRSIPNGFVEWVEGNSNETSFARSIFPASYWDIVDIVAIVSSEKKEVPSSVGHTFSQSSNFFEMRKKMMKNKIELCKEYIEKKDFKSFGELIEEEALELHAIYLTSKPSLIYLSPESLMVIKEVKKWRESGLAVYFTLNTGQDLHIICEEKNAERVSQLIEKIKSVQRVIVNKPAEGTHIIEEHLF